MTVACTEDSDVRSSLPSAHSTYLQVLNFGLDVVVGTQDGRELTGPVQAGTQQTRNLLDEVVGSKEAEVLHTHQHE